MQALNLPRIARLVVIAGAVFCVVFALIIALNIRQGSLDTWVQAERAGNNLVHTMARDIQRHFEVSATLLDEVAETLQDPAFTRSDDALRRLVKRSTRGNGGHMIVLGSDGAVIADSDIASGTATGNFAHQDYFRVHEEHPDTGVFVSPPHLSRLERGAPSMMLSRRFNGPDGRFAGVVAIAIRLTYVDDLFSAMDKDPEDALTLLREDGIVVVRQPAQGPSGDMGLNVAKSGNFRRFVSQTSGSFIGTAQIDGVERFYTFQHIEGFPLIVVAGFSVGGLLDEWWHRAVTTAVATLLLCCGVMVAAITLRRELIRRAALEESLARLSITDELTGIPNRRRFDETIAREWDRAVRTRSPLSLIMIDVDRLRLINDRFGHTRGDEVLKSVARSIAACLRRANDIPARYEGEAFVTILPDTDAAGARDMAEHIRLAVQEQASRPEMMVTASLGVVTLRPTEPGLAGQLIATATDALNRAKEQGRNRVAFATAETAQPPVADAPPADADRARLH
ncbi:two component system fusion protein [Azorhizobium oxalatiphilum]|uniref:diguanylate cyclase n=1 Tax=Azorhizobium oxalatiphilum TaxID=980631 RepID=A0A917C3Q4_9HYPH|nr:diguanylate cyclase [Azorhizobium oxalatiphilum]GGF70273.1 two component system fusion protein [Azorhizobium oxalatiphilum]